MTKIKDKQVLIDEFNELGNLQIKLNDGGSIEIEEWTEYITAERIGYSESMKCMAFIEQYGIFFDIETLLGTLEEKGVLIFEK